MVGSEFLTFGLLCFQIIPHDLVSVVSRDNVSADLGFPPKTLSIAFQQQHNGALTDNQ